MIEQTVTISDDHRIFLDLPHELPIGKAKVELTLTPLADVPQTEKNGKIRLSKSAINEMLQGETLLSLTGFLHTDVNAGEIRAERLRKHEHSN